MHLVGGEEKKKRCWFLFFFFFFLIHYFQHLSFTFWSILPIRRVMCVHTEFFFLLLISYTIDADDGSVFIAATEYVHFTNFHMRIISIEFSHRCLFLFMFLFNFCCFAMKCTFVHFSERRIKNRREKHTRIRSNQQSICMLKDISVSQIKIDLVIYKCATLFPFHFSHVMCWSACAHVRACVMFMYSFTNLNVTARQQRKTDKFLIQKYKFNERERKKTASTLYI